MSLRTIGSRVVIRPDKVETTSTGGIFLPGNQYEVSDRGTVMLVGNGPRFGDKVIPLEVKVGDKVFFVVEEAQPIKIEGEDVIIINEEHILAVIEEE